jgi:hypothetical protein
MARVRAARNRVHRTGRMRRYSCRALSTAHNSSTSRFRFPRIHERAQMYTHPIDTRMHTADVLAHLTSASAARRHADTPTAPTVLVPSVLCDTGDNLSSVRYTHINAHTRSVDCRSLVILKHASAGRRRWRSLTGACRPKAARQHNGLRKEESLKFLFEDGNAHGRHVDTTNGAGRVHTLR